jgi:hypothetical protein
MGNYITIPDVREEMLDRMAEDHLVLADLAFTDDDITWGMKAAARKYNSIPPMVSWVTWDKLPLNSSVFMDGVSWALIRRWHRNVAMNDYDYSSGGLQANVQGSLLRNLGNLRDKLESDFVKAATDLKVAINTENAFGNIG